MGSRQGRCSARFAEARKIVLSRSYGYANGNEDIAFLETVGYATAVNPKPALLEAARREGWKVLRFAARRKASAATLARSLGAYGTLAATSLGGLAYAVTTGKRRQAAELVSAIGGDAMLAMTGINVEVQGEHHLWAHRPSVFLFNHQSSVDVYVILSLLRHGITAVAKKELAKAPLIGHILRALDFAFIDRSNTRATVDWIQPVVDRLQLGLSVVIAPEGTRSRTPRLGRLQEGRLSYCHAGRCASRAAGHSQRLRGDAQKLAAVFNPARCRCACCRPST